MDNLLRLCVAYVAVSVLLVGMAHNAWAESINVGIFGAGSAFGPNCMDADQCYLPGEIVIDVGDQITWINKDKTPHTVVGGMAVSEGPNDTMNSGIMYSGQTFSHVFAETGRYPYFCMIHPWMGGVIAVVDGDDQSIDTLYAPAALDVHTYLDGAFAFVIGPQSTLSVIDITDVANPAFVSAIYTEAAFDSPYGPFDVEIYDTPDATYALVTDGDRGYASIIDVTDPHTPVRIQTAWDDAHVGQITDIEIFTKSDRIYAMMGRLHTDSVQIFDITDTDTPDILALLENGQYNIDTIRHTNDIEIYETSDKIYAAISGHHNTLQIVNITDPDTPEGLAGLGNVQNATDEQYGWHAAVWTISDGIYAAVSNYYNNTVKIIDLTDAQMPHTVGVIYGMDTAQDESDVSWRPSKIEIHTDARYVYATVLGGTADSGSLRIINVSDPHMPIPLSMIPDHQNDNTVLKSPQDVDILRWDDDIYAVIADTGNSAIRIIDITNPNNPIPVSSIQNRALPDV